MFLAQSQIRPGTMFGFAVDIHIQIALPAVSAPCSVVSKGAINKNISSLKI